MNDDELRAILKSEADRVGEDPDSWSRLESRLQGDRRRSYPRAFALGAMTIAVAVSLVGAIWLSRDARRAPLVAPRSGSMPSSIVAITTGGSLVVLDARAGRVVKTLVSGLSRVKGRTLDKVSVSLDGRTVYYTSGGPRAGSKCSALQDFVMKLPMNGGMPKALGLGRMIAVSPDGRYLAYYRCRHLRAPSDALVLLDLSSSGERVVEAPSQGSFGDRIAFEADSRHVVYESISKDDPKADGVDRLYRFDLVGGEALPGAELGVAPFAWFGVKGATGAYLGRLGSRKNSSTGRRSYSVARMRPLDPNHPEAFGSGQLFWVPGLPRQVTSDGTGDHILAIAADTLYRWNEGETKPTKVRDGIVAAAWIPDAPERRAAPAVPRPNRILAMTTDHRPIVISARSGTRLRSYRGDLYAEGTSIAVSPDGRDFYDVEGDGNEGCGAHIVFRRSLTRANRDYPLAAEASEPAISPDGRRLAFLRCLPSDDRPDELVVRNLRSGKERVWKAPPSARLGEAVVFDGDSRHVVVSLFNPLLPGPQRSLLSRVDGFVDGTLPDLAMTVPSGDQTRIVASVGRTGHYLGMRDHSLVELIPCDCLTLNYSAHELVRVPRYPPNFVSADASGQHVLFVVGRDLYRWNRGEQKPTLVRQGVMAAAWLGG